MASVSRVSAADREALKRFARNRIPDLGIAIKSISEPKFFVVLLSLLTLAAVGIRLLRLDWQPLWWDEGYSVYFATEPLTRMAWLTARDIHPPLYYALANGWVTLFGTYRPEVFRLFSVVCALPAIPLTALLARQLWPRRPKLALLVAGLLALSPMHIYYSQEVRMYGLALTLSLGASLTYIIYTKRLLGPTPADLAPIRRMGLLYALLAALGLYSLYYVALLILAHLLWMIYLSRETVATDSRPFRLPINAFIPFLWIALLYVPWIAYAVPQLLPYIQDKVVADEDTALGLLAYLWTHWVAFTGGHVAAEVRWLDLARYAGLLTPLILVAVWRFSSRAAPSQPSNPAHMLASFLVVPIAVGYLINLVFPFFPQGGERLLFIVLPYFLLLIVGQLFPAKAPDKPSQEQLSTGLLSTGLLSTSLQWFAGGLLVISACAGTAIFFTTPRYVDDDYRPLIRTVVTAGRDTDTALAIFPWQIGYWRAYAPQEGGEPVTPQPPPLDQEALVWNEAVRQRIDRALARGTVWFPAPLGFGSNLPHEIENYLVDSAANAHNAWVSPTTHLSAWTGKVDISNRNPVPAAQSLQLGPIALHKVYMDGDSVETANYPLALQLHWGAATSTADLRVLLQLRELAQPDAREQRVWASRSYEPLGRYAVDSNRSDATGVLVEDIAIRIPAGIPPGEYELAIAVEELDAQASSAALHTADERQPAASQPTSGEATQNQSVSFTSLAQLQVEPSSETLSPVRLPVELPAPESWFARVLPWHPRTTVEASGLRLYGVSGLAGSIPVLAGTVVEPMLHLAVVEPSGTPPSTPFTSIDMAPDTAPDTASGTAGDSTAAAQLVLELRTPTGSVAAESVEWPFPHRPLDVWERGSLISAPLSLFLPGYLAPGEGYTLWAGIEAAGERTLMPVASLTIDRRAHRFELPPAESVAETVIRFEKPYQLGTHARLLGYDVLEHDLLENGSAAETLTFKLHWQVLNPIHPPHHIFVHLTDATGDIVEQHDGEPRLTDSPAPTGSWVPDEYLTTVHQFPRLTTEHLANFDSLTAHTGLYDPNTETRLPVSLDGETIGDHVSLPLTLDTP